MARARNIKPGFFANPELVELPFVTRLLFIGLWTVADRAGRMEDRPKKIKMSVFPADDVDVDAGLNDLQTAGFLLRYEHEGNRYIQILAFDKHQHPHKDEKASTIPAPCEHGASTVQEPSKHDGNPADSLIADSRLSDSSVPSGTGADAPSEQSGKPAEQMTKDELWAAGKSLLQQSGMPGKQCGSFVGKLVKDYGSEIVIEAVQSAVVERPADPASFLKAACMARKGEGGKTLIPWHATDVGVIAKGEGMDPSMRPHPGESMLQFKARLLAAIENDGKPPDPKPKPALAITNEAKSHKPEGIAPLKSLIKIREPA